MSVYALTGDPAKGGIPRHARVRIEAMPGRRVVFDGVASKAVHLDLDPGLYVYSVAKFWEAPEGEPQPGVVYDGEFYHDITPEQWLTLRVMKPRFSRGIMTSDGAKWFCRATGCHDSFTSQVAAVLHEHRDHLGIDLLKADNPLIASEQGAAAAPRVSLQPDVPAPGLPGKFGATIPPEFIDAERVKTVLSNGPSGPAQITPGAGARPTKSAIIGLPTEGAAKG